MVKDVVLRFLSIMLLISVILITHLTWDIYNSSEAGKEISDVYHADVKALEFSVSIMLVSWLIFALVIREVIISTKMIKARALASRFDERHIP